MRTQRFSVDRISQAIGAVDVFVCCASYEARCETIARKLSQNAARHAIVAENMNHRATHGEHPANLLARFAGRVQHAETSTEDPLATADGLARALARLAVANTFLIDMTTFTHEALLILVRLIRDRFPSATIRYAYTAAQEYSVGDEKSTKWLSRGVKEVRSVLGYPGRLTPSRKLHLILLAGIEHERATELVRACEPSILSLGKSTNDTSDECATAIFEERFALLKAFFPSAHQFSFDCYSPANTAAALRVQVGITRNHNVVVAPMSTKLSTLAAAAVAIEEDRVQLCYAPAVLYNYRGYSIPGDMCYLVDPDVATASPALTADTHTAR